MGMKTLIFLVIAVLISACSAEEKTRPIVTDITASVVGNIQEVNESEEEIGENETIPEEVEGEIEENKTRVVGEETEEIEEEEKEELPAGAQVITIKELRLEPQELTIEKGDTVVWKHEDKWEKNEETKHYLAAHSNEFRSPILYYGSTFEHTFNKTGTFTYIDVMYKERSYMRGKIIVE